MLNRVCKIKLKTNCDTFDCSLNDLYLSKRGIIMKERILHQKYLKLMSERSILINADTFLSNCPYWFFMMVSSVSTITYFSSNFSWAAWPKIIESPFLMLHYWNGLLTSFRQVANEVKCEFRSTKKDLLMQLRQVIYLPNSSLTYPNCHCLPFIFSFSHLYSWVGLFLFRTVRCEFSSFTFDLHRFNLFVVQLWCSLKWINILVLKMILKEFHLITIFCVKN